MLFLCLYLGKQISGVKGSFTPPSLRTMFTPVGLKASQNLLALKLGWAWICLGSDQAINTPGGGELDPSM